MITEIELVKKHYILQQEELVKDEPFLCFDGFGFECAAGWFDLIDQLCTDIEKELDKNPAMKKKFKIHQIKEKFGSMRFNVGACTEDIMFHIDNAEEKSHHICETCGEPGKIYDIRGWCSNYCNKCLNKRLVYLKKETIDSMSQTKYAINKLSKKKDCTAEENIELSEAKEWSKICDENLQEIKELEN